MDTSISPFLELAKALNDSDRFSVYICSTSTNLVSVTKTLRNERLSLSIKVIELLLPELPDLPSEPHSTNGLPVHLMPILKQAFDLSSPRFLEVLKDLRPDLLIYDILQPWAPAAAAGLGIPSVVFITTSAAASMYHFELNAPKDHVPFPFGNIIYYREHENVKVVTNAKEKEENIITQCVASSSHIVVIKTFKDIEGKYSDHLSLLTDKKIVPVGPLVADPYVPDLKQNNVMQWLDTKAIGSTVFVSFGSEYFLSSADLKEIAYGLEKSNVNFIWVLRFPKGEGEIESLGLERMMKKR
nr:beta-D-glucosyl crocetin beta-1,6-glucosyltransferase [Tanacetum cinerariifolium]